MSEAFWNVNGPREDVETVRALRWLVAPVGGVIMLETGGRTPDGRQSKPTASHRRRAGPRRGSSELHARTTLADRLEGVRGANRGALGRPEICVRPRGRPAEFPAAILRRAAKTVGGRVKSRTAPKFRIRGFWTRGRVRPELRFGFIQKPAEGWPWMWVADQSLPGRVVVQFWKQRGQFGGQFLPLRGRKLSDRVRDLVDHAHGANSVSALPDKVKCQRSRPSRWPRHIEIGLKTAQ